jgi:Na+-driven multidrug efflux pump
MRQRERYGTHFRALVGSNLAQMSLHVTDTVMLGWYEVKELAAVVLGASSFSSFSSLARASRRR